MFFGKIRCAEQREKDMFVDLLPFIHSYIHVVRCAWCAHALCAGQISLTSGRGKNALACDKCCRVHGGVSSRQITSFRNKNECCVYQCPFSAAGVCLVFVCECPGRATAVGLFPRALSS